jgi:4-amino-4-deoxy-L-arabinose transferase-like glycosyltransferase
MSAQDNSQAPSAYPSGHTVIRLFYDWLARVTERPVYLYVVLAGITAVATLLRLYKLGDWSFWGDELFSVSGQEDGFNYNLLRQSLSLALIQAVTAVNGTNEWNARIVPAIIGIISIPILYFLVRKIFDPQIALLAVLLLAISPWHIYWSQNARFYTAILLFYSVALLFFYLGMEQDRPWYLFLSILFLGLAAKERLFALFFIPVALVYLLLLNWLRFGTPPGWRTRNGAIFIIPALIGGLFFAGPYVGNLPEWMIGFGRANNNPVWLFAGFVAYVGLPVICLGTVGGLYGIAQKNRAALLLLLNATLPLLLLMLIAPFHYTANRYAFISLTSWFILTAVTVLALWRKLPRPANLLLIGVFLILLLQPLGDDVLYYTTQMGNRDNWKSAFAVVKEQKQADDLVVSTNGQLARYYLQENTLDFVGLNRADLSQSKQRMWVIEDNVAIEHFPHIHQWLTENARLMAVFDVTAQARTFNMRVYLYEPPEP